MPTPDQGDYPTGYMTPDQIAQMYQQSSALSKGGQRDAEITSPWQGARMMADALAGRSMRNQAGAAQAQNTFGAGRQTAAIQPPGGAPQAPMLPSIAPTPPSATPGSFGTPTPPIPQPRPIMGTGSPVANAGITGSGMPGAPMSGGIPQQQGGINPMMAALMSQPPAM